MFSQRGIRPTTRQILICRVEHFRPTKMIRRPHGSHMIPLLPHTFKYQKLLFSCLIFNMLINRFIHAPYLFQ